MAEQYDFFGGCEEPPAPKPKIDKVKRNWENRFQRWSDKMAEVATTTEGKCGYGFMCDYCEDNTYGRPCVRAFNEVLRSVEKYNIKVDYEKLSFEDAWDGRF